MKYNPYVKGAPNVSEMGIGAWQLGKSPDWTSMTEQEAISLVHRALDLGINFFDTAPNYGLGTSEIRLGNALEHIDRDTIVINSKFGHLSTGELNFASTVIRESLEGSLRRLKTDYLDTLIIHNPPRNYLDGTRTDHYEILEKLVAEGKIKAYGASLDTYDEMKLLLDTTESKVIEAFFNILFQDTARAFELAKEKDVAIIAKIPLDSGWLAGKYSPETEFEDIRKRWSGDDKKLRFELVQQLEELLPPNVKLADAALQFCLAFDAVSTVIPGNKNMAQLESNYAGIQNRLSKEMVLKLQEFYIDKVKHLNLPW